MLFGNCNSYSLVVLPPLEFSFCGRGFNILCWGPVGRPIHPSFGGAGRCIRLGYCWAYGFSHLPHLDCWSICCRSAKAECALSWSILYSVLSSKLASKLIKYALIELSMMGPVRVNPPPPHPTIFNINKIGTRYTRKFS